MNILAIPQCIPAWFTRAAALVALAIVGGVTGGCASYATPGRGADMAAFGVNREAQTDAGIAPSLAKQPLASLPTAIAVVRVQSPGYHTDTAVSWGSGRYSIVTTRDVETDEQVARLRKLPMVSGIAAVNRLLLPTSLSSDLELRQAAATLHADMLLVYTIDTTFAVEDKAGVLTVITLGLSPNQVARVVSTASAVLMDTRNGYIYGVSEATERGTQLASGWTSASAVDDVRRRTETAAFEKLVGEVEKTWAGVVREHLPPTTVPTTATRP